MLAGNIRASACRHPSVFPLLLQRPAMTAEARQAREAVYRALDDAGVPDDRVAQVERLVSTAVLGFAVSEGGRPLPRPFPPPARCRLRCAAGIARRFIHAQAAKEPSG